jgi:hypothetical protein
MAPRQQQESDSPTPESVMVQSHRRQTEMASRRQSYIPSAVAELPAGTLARKGPAEDLTTGAQRYPHAQH